MFLGYLLDLDLLARDPIAYFVNLLVAVAILGTGMLVGITIHEFSHALVANHLGDGTAKRLGRLSLNPIVHLDPVGTLLIVLAGFGWGKPVPVNPYYLRGGMAKAMAIVSLAGPVSNVIVAAIVALAIRFGPLAWHPAVGYLFAIGPAEIGLFLMGLVSYMIQINLILAVFNLIPIAPLDGFKVALGILPRELANSLARTEPYGMAILVMLFAFDFIFHVGIFGRILSPIISALFGLLVGPVGYGLM